MRFVADKCIPVGFYINTNWAAEHFLQDNNICKKEIETIIAYIIRNSLEKEYSTLLDYYNSLQDYLQAEPYDKKMPRFVYMSQKDWETKNQDELNLPVQIPKNEVIFASDIVNRAYLEERGLNANNAILLLAACGIDILLPTLSFEISADEEIERLKEDLNEERTEYLNVLSSIANKSYEKIKSEDFDDLYEWANNEIYFQLLPKVRNLESQTKKTSKKTLKSAGLEFWSDSIPIISQSFITTGMGNGLKTSATELIKTLTAVINKTETAKESPELSYLLSLKKLNRYH